MDWSGIISKDDLSPKQQEMVDVIGIDAYVALTRHFGGENTYIPKFDEMVKDPRNREIRKKYDGYNTISLAREYRLSERYIRLLTCDLRRERQSQPLENQLYLDSWK